MLEALTHTDQQLLLWLNGHHSPFFDWFMYAASGRFEWIPLYIILLFFIFRKYRWKGLWVLLAVVVLITLTDQAGNLLKNSVRRLRPCHDPEIAPFVHLVKNYCGGTYGFVSAHAANSFGLATFISLLFRKRWVTAGMMAWALIISYSRIYLGAHYPGDVVCGALTGTILAITVYLILSRLMNRLYPRS
jgi:undecaprenyl-diphosphatase